VCVCARARACMCMCAYASESIIDWVLRMERGLNCSIWGHLRDTCLHPSVVMLGVCVFLNSANLKLGFELCLFLKLDF
jgi:hypothetical protein